MHWPKELNLQMRLRGASCDWTGPYLETLRQQTADNVNRHCGLTGAKKVIAEDTFVKYTFHGGSDTQLEKPTPTQLEQEEPALKLVGKEEAAGSKESTVETRKKGRWSFQDVVNSEVGQMLAQKYNDPRKSTLHLLLDRKMKERRG